MDPFPFIPTPEEQRRRQAIAEFKPRVKRLWDGSHELCTLFMSEGVVGELAGISSSGEAPYVDEQTLNNRWKIALRARQERRAINFMSSINLTIEDASVWKTLKAPPPSSNFPRSKSTQDTPAKALHNLNFTKPLKSLPEQPPAPRSKASPNSIQNEATSKETPTKAGTLHGPSPPPESSRNANSTSKEATGKIDMPKTLKGSSQAVKPVPEATAPRPKAPPERSQTTALAGATKTLNDQPSALKVPPEKTPPRSKAPIDSLQTLTGPSAAVKPIPETATLRANAPSQNVSYTSKETTTGKEVGTLKTFSGPFSVVKNPAEKVPPRSKTPSESSQNLKSTSKERVTNAGILKSLNGPSSAVMDLEEAPAIGTSALLKRPAQSEPNLQLRSAAQNFAKRPRSNRRRKVASKSVLSNLATEADRLKHVVASAKKENIVQREPIRWELRGIPTSNFSKQELKKMPVLYARRATESDEEDETFLRS